MRLPVLVVALVSGCSLTDFDIEQPIVEQRVQGSPIPGPLQVLFPLPLDLDLSAAIRERETGPIDSVNLTSLELTITPTARPTGDTDDWSFVESIRVFVRSSQSGSTLPRVEIASVTSPGATTTMKFVCNSKVDLDPYVNEGSVIESEGRGTLPPDDVTYDGKAVFTVHPL
ncbi:MAG: hypothetical protein H0T46_16860 [Deltaproteobacteria bacterium]|nr:hypothetical protein [Deltaproteobacteria bacterium]